MQAEAKTAEPLLPCGNCRQAMRRLTLPGHYGHSVDLDMCTNCDLVWFDLIESAQLGGTGLLELIDDMARSQESAHEMLRADPRCPRCDGRLGIVHNQSRFGQSTQLQCLRRHGAYQSFAQFLQEKGLLRPMSRIDRAKLLRDRGKIDCVNCGAEIGAADERCRFCHGIPSLLDIARLAHALDPQDTIEPPAVYATQARQSALQCAACGAALPPDETISCSQCGATLAITSLAEANAAVQALAPALRAAAERPSPEVVKRRLEALDADLPRRRDWVAGMEAETRRHSALERQIEWSSLWSRQSNPVRAVVLALVVGLVWWRLRR
ncbi:MAG: hypothetical protein ABJA61_09405 [Caldimonas sp.]